MVQNPKFPYWSTAMSGYCRVTSTWFLNGPETDHDKTDSNPWRERERERQRERQRQTERERERQRYLLFNKKNILQCFIKGILITQSLHNVPSAPSPKPFFILHASFFVLHKMQGLVVIIGLRWMKKVHKWSLIKTILLIRIWYQYSMMIRFT